MPLSSFFWWSKSVCEKSWYVIVWNIVCRQASGRVAILSAIFLWVGAIWFRTYHFFPSVHVNVCWSSKPAWAFCTRCNFILIYVFKDNIICFCFMGRNCGKLFYVLCFWTLFFQPLDDVCGNVMFPISVIASIPKSNLRAFFITLVLIASTKGFLVWFLFLTDFLSLVWIASHSEISSSFPCFHHSIFLFKYLTCSLCFDLDDDF